jgi:hypothetical protein
MPELFNRALRLHAAWPLELRSAVVLAVGASGCICLLRTAGAVALCALCARACRLRLAPQRGGACQAMWPSGARMSRAHGKRTHRRHGEYSRLSGAWTHSGSVGMPQPSAVSHTRSPGWWTTCVRPAPEAESWAVTWDRAGSLQKALGTSGSLETPLRASPDADAARDVPSPNADMARPARSPFRRSRLRNFRSRWPVAQSHVTLVVWAPRHAGAAGPSSCGGPGPLGLPVPRQAASGSERGPGAGAVESLPPLVEPGLLPREARPRMVPARRPGPRHGYGVEVDYSVAAASRPGHLRGKGP